MATADSTQCGCVETCLTTAASGGTHPCSVTGAGITEAEADGWIAAGCPSSDPPAANIDCTGTDPDLPCHVMRLIDEVRDAASLDDIDR